MRVLILTQYYAPEPVDKFVDLARGLGAMGHDVQVITGFPCYPYGRTYQGYRQSLYREESLDGALVTRIPQIPDHSKSALRRALYYVSFALSLATIGLVRARRADVILVYQSALPIGLAAWLLSCIKRVPLVLDVVDLWPESVAASGMMTNGPALKLIRRAARFLYSRAGQINVITEGYRDNLVAMGVPPQKIAVIHHWPSAGKFDRAARDEAFSRREGFAGRFTILYAGSMGPCQQLETVLSAAGLLQDVPQVQFVLAGDGVDFERLKELTAQQKIDNVRFAGRRSPEDISKMYGLADALLVHLKPDPMSRVSIPSKTFAYMASGRPLLMAVEGEAGRLVQKHRCGISIPPSDPAAMAGAIRSLLRLSPDERSRMADAALRAYRDHYSSEVQIRKVVDKLDLVVSRKAA